MQNNIDYQFIYQKLLTLTMTILGIAKKTIDSKIFVKKQQERILNHIEGFGITLSPSIKRSEIITNQ